VNGFLALYARRVLPGLYCKLMLDYAPRQRLPTAYLTITPTTSLTLRNVVAAAARCTFMRNTCRTTFPIAVSAVWTFVAFHAPRRCSTCLYRPPALLPPRPARPFSRLRNTPAVTHLYIHIPGAFTHYPRGCLFVVPFPAPDTPA